MFGLQVIFWIGLALLFYIYVGYPLLIGFLARFFPRPVRRAHFHASCSVIMAGYNEGPRLADKIRHLLSLVGSEQITEILVGSDGSTDTSEAELRGINDSRVKFVLFTERRGKPAVLNDLIAKATGEILLMTDVRQKFSHDALVKLLRNFHDDSVGVVSGELVFIRDFNDTSAVAGISAYWRYEKWIRKAESNFASVPGATGAIYAIRRRLIHPMPPHLILDDVVFPMFAILRGNRCIFEPEAMAYDVPSRDLRKETIRKRRTIAGCIQLMVAFPSWVIPGYNPIAWQFVSHKILRLYSPWLLILVLMSSIMLRDNIIYYFLMLVQVCGYSVGLIGFITNRLQIRIPLLGVTAMFIGMQSSIILAWFDLFRGRARVTWDIRGTRGE